MKRFFAVALYLLVVIPSMAQILKVTDNSSQEPMVGVVVSSDNPHVSVITNAKGETDVSAFKGAVKIEISYLGYQTQVYSFTQLEESAFSVTLEDVGIFGKGFVVTANRLGSSTEEITQVVTSISSEEVALQNPQTAADLLGSSGSVLIQKSQQGGGSPMIRGFATNRVLISVDGVRMNNAIFRSGNVQNVISLDPLAVERTEILFGPGSVMYGSDAIGGVMGFFTLQPKFSSSSEPLITGNALTRYASANTEFTGHANVNIGWKKWAMVTSFSHNQFDHLRMGKHGHDEYLRPTYVSRIDDTDVVVKNEDPLLQVPTHYSQDNFMQKVRWKPTDKFYLQYALHYSNTSDYGRYDRHIRTRDGLPRSGEWYYGPQVWTMNHLSGRHTDTTKLYDDFSFSVAHQFFEESRYDRDFNDHIQRERIEKVNAYSLNLDFSKKRKHSKWFYGIEGVFNQVQSKGNDLDILTEVQETGPSRYPDALWGSYAAYATWQRKLSTKWLVQVGARYGGFALQAKFDTSFYSLPFTEASLNKMALSGSAGLSYFMSESSTFKLNLSTGFRAPNVDDIGKVFDSEPGAVVVPNPNLDAENAYNAELVHELRIKEKFSLQTVAFYTLLDKALVRRAFQLNGLDSIEYAGELSSVQAIQNAAQAYVYGFQANLKYSFPKAFMLSSTFSYQRGEEEMNDGSTSALRHAGPWFGATHLVYTHHPVKLDWYANYNGQVAFDDLALSERSKDYLYLSDASGNPYAPSWFTLNFKIQVKLSEVWSVSGGIENILDRRYRPYSSGLVASGRNIQLSLRASF